MFFQVKIHAEEMSESETAFMLEQGQLGLRRMGDQLGPLAGWFKDNIDQGPSLVFDLENLSPWGLSINDIRF